MAQPSSEEPLPNPRNRPSVESYSLPPGPNNTSEQNVLQGPVDEEIPIARPPIVTPRATPVRAPSESGSPAAGSVATDSRDGQAQQPVRQAPLRPDPAAQIVPAETDPALENTPAATGEQMTTMDSPVSIIDAKPSPPESRAEPDSPKAANDWQLLLVAALFFILPGAIYLWRARRGSVKRPAAAKADAVEPLQTNPVAKLPEPHQPAPAVAISFQPQSANSTLFNAVVVFELALSNPGSEDLTGIRVAGAMIQAGEDGTRNPLSADLTPLGVVSNLEPGNTEKIVTEFRVPLASIHPIMFRSQALFVPLIQISIEFTDGAGFQHFQTAAYLVGLEHQPPRLKMAPFRLDLGPRSFAPLGHRPLATG